MPALRRREVSSFVIPEQYTSRKGHTNSGFFQLGLSCERDHELREQCCYIVRSPDGRQSGPGWLDLRIEYVAS